MRVLLTRAAEDAERTRTKVEALGHRVTVSPMIDIVATGATWPEGAVDAVIATSGQAFAIMDGWSLPAPETRRIVPLYLVGERTAEQASHHGFLGARIVAPNAASLALALGKLPAWPARVIYLAGRDRKPDLETALEIIGRRPEVREVYEAREAAALTPDAITLLRERADVTILHFSRRSAQIFVRACERTEIDAASLRHLCLSDDVVGPLRKAGCAEVQIAAAPNEAALLALLDRV